MKVDYEEAVRKRDVKQQEKLKTKLGKLIKDSLTGFNAINPKVPDAGLSAKEKREMKLLR